MASDITNFLENEFFDAYAEGREDEARVDGMAMAVWSSILDDASCDFCRWADERTFPLSSAHLNPPVHFGCRCILVYYTSDMIEEDELEPDQMFLPWETPPDEVFPPGTKKKGS
jgi:hypothetical protein